MAAAEQAFQFFYLRLTRIEENGAVEARERDPLVAEINRHRRPGDGSAAGNPLILVSAADVYRQLCGAGGKYIGREQTEYPHVYAAVNRQRVAAAGIRRNCAAEGQIGLGAGKA